MRRHSPRHVAIIMDGNNRWAKRKAYPGPAGHRAGVEAVRGILRACKRHGVEVLTLFAFSSENWGRPCPKCVPCWPSCPATCAMKSGNCTKTDPIRFIGEREPLQPATAAPDAAVRESDLGNTGATVVIAVDYGGQWDIAQAAQKLAQQVQEGSLQPQDITPELIDRNISISDLPRPDLCIRTGGDARISNFMLWHFAYSELYFTDTLWPDFGELEFARALADYSIRERRFGLREPDGLVAGGDADA